MTNDSKLNVRTYDNGDARCVTVNGLIVSAHNSLGGAWEHIAWMYRVAGQNFTVGEGETPVADWLKAGIELGFFTKDIGYHG